MRRKVYFLTCATGVIAIFCGAGPALGQYVPGPYDIEEEFDRDDLIRQLEGEMYNAAEQLDFERAAGLRDRIAELKAMPDYGSPAKVRRSEVEAVKPKPGESRSRAGITGRGKKRRGGA